VQPSASKRPAVPVAEQERVRSRNRNLVFVVDDDAAMLRSVARLLQQSGYIPLLFSSAEAFANHDDFDRAACIILDIDLGDGSGIELRHRLKAANISVPVIYISQASEERCVWTPFSCDLIQFGIRRCSRMWHLVDQQKTIGH
jgi:DNA-binding NtrC family response regulator